MSHASPSFLTDYTHWQWKGALIIANDADHRPDELSLKHLPLAPARVAANRWVKCMMREDADEFQHVYHLGQYRHRDRALWLAYVATHVNAGTSPDPEFWVHMVLNHTLSRHAYRNPLLMDAVVRAGWKSCMATLAVRGCRVHVDTLRWAVLPQNTTDVQFKWLFGQLLETVSLTPWMEMLMADLLDGLVRLSGDADADPGPFIARILLLTRSAGFKWASGKTRAWWPSYFSNCRFITSLPDPLALRLVQTLWEARRVRICYLGALALLALTSDRLKVFAYLADEAGVTWELMRPFSVEGKMRGAVPTLLSSGMVTPHPLPDLFGTWALGLVSS